jgi:hypothetical protein
MKIKNILTTGLMLLTMCVGFTACGYIEEDTTSQVTDDKLTDSEESLNYWVTGVYSKWVYDMFCWGYFPQVLELDADYITGPSWFFGALGSGNFQGETDAVDALWKGCYGLIERSNLAMRKIRVMQNVRDEVKNNAIGELKFHKAIAYFLLVRAYGPIPLVGEEENVTFDYNNNPRVPVVQVYDEIFRLLKDAAANMYTIDDKSFMAGHVSAGSAVGLLVKAYATAASAAMPVGTRITVLNGHPYRTSESGATTYEPLHTIPLEKTVVKGYENMNAAALYGEAVAWGKRLIEDGEFGKYELEPTFRELWSYDRRTAPEFMFCVYVPSGDAKFKSSVHTQYEGYFKAVGSPFIQGGGYLGCTRHWYALFDSKDSRIVDGVKHSWRNYYQEETNSGNVYPEGYDAKDPSGHYIHPELDPDVDWGHSYDEYHIAYTTKYADVLNNAIENADSPWPFLRLADVYLMYAEALNETGNLDGARLWLDKVFDRAHPDGVGTFDPLRGNSSTTYSRDLSTRDAMRTAIIEERAKELACEADRRWDLIRWGIYVDAMNKGFNLAEGYGTDDGGISKSRQAGKHELYPIPEQEININQAITGNNPGWR